MQARTCFLVVLHAQPFQSRSLAFTYDVSQMTSKGFVYRPESGFLVDQPLVLEAYFCWSRSLCLLHYLIMFGVIQFRHFRMSGLPRCWIEHILVFLWNTCNRSVGSLIIHPGPRPMPRACSIANFEGVIRTIPASYHIHLHVRSFPYSKPPHFPQPLSRFKTGPWHS